MIDGLTPAHWAKLRSQRPQSEDALTVLPISVGGVETRLSMAMGQSGYLHLLISIDHSSGKTLG